MDLTNINITGKEAEEVLEKINITVNKNGIPYDKKSPFVTSGIRLGTPALTTRGMKEKEMKIIGRIIFQGLQYKEDEKKLISLKEEVIKLSKEFPLYK